jgi:hypothetical protein
VVILVLADLELFDREVPPRSITMSMTCGSIIESMMCPVKTRRAV